MPASRASGWLLEALDSVLAQELADLEVIVTDDSTGDIAALLARRPDPRVRVVVNEEPLGFARNHCRALSLASADVIAFLHDDDRWEPGYLSAAVDVLDQQPEVGLVLVDAIEVDEHGHELGLRPPGVPPGLHPDPLTALLRRDFVACVPSASVFRRAALAANHRPWPDVIAGDLTMYVDCILGGWGVFRLPEPLGRYRVHDGQISDDVVMMRTAVIAVLGRYRFADPTHEDRRLRRLASEFVSRAAARLKAGDARGAKSDIKAAGGFSRVERWPWALLIRTLANLPPGVYRAVDAGLRRLRTRLRRSRRTGQPGSR